MDPQGKKTKYKIFEKPYLLIVEGKDDKYFFEAFLQNIESDEAHDLMAKFEVYFIEGKNNLSNELKAIVNTPNFNITVKSIGIVIDSNSNPEATFKSIQHSLHEAHLPIPSSEFSIAGNDQRVSILLIPGDNEKGNLECLLLQSVANDPSIECIENYIGCIQEKGLRIESNLCKAKAQIFLARFKDVQNIGIASKKSIWPFESNVFSKIKEFILNLANE